MRKCAPMHLKRQERLRNRADGRILSNGWTITTNIRRDHEQGEDSFWGSSGIPGGLHYGTQSVQRAGDAVHDWATRLSFARCGKASGTEAMVRALSTKTN